jgi:hypothetical protein
VLVKISDLKGKYIVQLSTAPYIFSTRRNFTGQICFVQVPGVLCVRNGSQRNSWTLPLVIGVVREIEEQSFAHMVSAGA